MTPAPANQLLSHLPLDTDHQALMQLHRTSRPMPQLTASTEGRLPEALLWNVRDKAHGCVCCKDASLSSSLIVLFPLGGVRRHFFLFSGTSGMLVFPLGKWFAFIWRILGTVQLIMFHLGPGCYKFQSQICGPPLANESKFIVCLFCISPILGSALWLYPCFYIFSFSPASNLCHLAKFYASL